MSEELEFRRRLAEHERRFLQPARVDLDALAGALGYRGDEPGHLLWDRAIARGRLPSGWSDRPERRFRATERELRRVSDGLEAGREPLPESFADRGGRARYLLPTPATARAALIFASDPSGLSEAERLGRLVVDALQVWGGPKVARIAWRLAGNPIDRPTAGGPPLGDLRPALDRLRAGLAGTTRIYEPAHPHARFQLVAELLHAARRRTLLLDSTVPALVRSSGATRSMPDAAVGRRWAELPDPLGPWLALTRLGYSLWAITGTGSGAVLELAAPFPVARRFAQGRARGQAQPRAPVQALDGRAAEPDARDARAVWSARLTGIRLACARADVGAVRSSLPMLADDDEPDQPKLIHFAVYGGPEVLRCLAEHGHQDLEARDPAGRTPLMLAASLPRSGPAGARKHEIDVPISDLVGAAACEWLIAAGADPNARDGLGQTALHLAAPNRCTHAVAALVEGGAEVDAVDSLGRTPLMRALGAGVHTELVEVLLAAGADPDIRDHHGWTALHYLAATGVTGAGQRGLARRLQAKGARPSRDRAGRSPAELSMLQGVVHSDLGPLDARTAVASGPGPGAVAVAHGFEPTLIDELVAELVPDPSALDNPFERPRPRSRGDAWQVWADWLQSRGDPRGELVATSLACARVGSRRRRALASVLVGLEQRALATTVTGLAHADPLAPTRPSPIELERTHGFVTKARLSELGFRRYSGLAGNAALTETLIAAIAPLLAHEPLLADLRLGVEDSGAWEAMLTRLRTLGPIPSVRRLVLERLPATVPDLHDLHRQFPKAHTLWLLGAGKLNHGQLSWPGLESLRLRHGDSSEWTRGGVALEFVLPDLRYLDFALPVGARSVPAELEGCVATLTRLRRVQHLRLRPLSPDFAGAILASPVVERLRSLELVGVRGPTLAVLTSYATKLRRLERTRVVVSSAVASQRAIELAELRGEVPGLVVETRD